MMKLTHGLALLFVVVVLAAACAADSPTDDQIGVENPPESSVQPDADPGPEPELTEEPDVDPIVNEPEQDTEEPAEDIEEPEVVDPEPDAIELVVSDTLCRDQADGSELDPTANALCIGSDRFKVRVWPTDAGASIEVFDLDVDPEAEVLLFFVGDGPVGFQWSNDGTFDAFYGAGFENVTTDPGAAQIVTGDGTVTLTDLWLSEIDGVVSLANPGGTTLGGMEVPAGEHPLVEFTVFISTEQTLNSFLVAADQFTDAFATVP